MTPLTAFIVGAFLGATLGIGLMALLSINREERDLDELDSTSDSGRHR